MADIADLGLRVSGEDGVLRATDALDRFAGAAGRADAAAEGLNTNTMGQGAASAAQQVDLLERSLVGAWAAMMKGHGVNSQAINDLLGVERGFTSAAMSAEVFAQAAKGHATVMDQLNRSLDGVYDGAQRYAEIERQVAIAVANQSDLQAQGNRILELARERYLGTSDAALMMADSSRVAGFAAQNVGYQINDIAVMMASGQNPFVLGMQQGMQLSQIWQGMGSSGGVLSTLKAGLLALVSPMTLATVAAITAAAAFVNWLSSSSEEAGTLEESIQDLSQGMGDYDAAAQRAAEGSDRLSMAMSGGKSAADAYLASLKGVTAAANEATFATTVGQFAREQGYSPGAAPSASNLWMGGIGVTRETIAHMPETENLDGAQIQQIADALERLADPALDPAQRIDALAEYVGVLTGIWPVVDDMPKVFREAAIQAGALIEQGEKLVDVPEVLTRAYTTYYNSRVAGARAVAQEEERVRSAVAAQMQFQRVMANGGGIAVANNQPQSVAELNRLYGELAMVVGEYERAVASGDEVQAAAAQRAERNLREQISGQLEAESRLAALGEKGDELTAIMDEIDFDGEGEMREVLDRINASLTAAGENVLALDEHDIANLEGSFASFEDRINGILSSLGLVRGELNQFHEAPYTNSRRVSNNEAFTENFASQMEAATNGILALIRHVEGTEGPNSYNTSLAHGRYLPGDREQDLVNKTLAEIRDLQRYMLAQPDNHYNSSALGAYQIVGDTLQGLIDKLQLDPHSTRFTPEVQDMLAMELVRQRSGQGLTGFQNEWQGILHQGVSQQTLNMALGATGPGGRGQAGVARGGIFPEVEERNQARIEAGERAINAIIEERTQLLQQTQTEAQKYEEQIASADRLLAMGQINPEQHAQIVAQLTAALSENQQAQRDLESVLDDSVPKWQQIQEQIEMVTHAYNEGQISLAQYTQAMAHLNEEAVKLAVGNILADTPEDAGKQFDDLKAAIEGFSSSIAGAVANSTSLKGAWEAIGDTIENSLRRIAATLIQTGLENVILGAFGLGAGGAGNGMAGMAAGLLNVFTGGGGTMRQSSMPLQVGVTVDGARGNMEIQEMVATGVSTGIQRVVQTEPERQVEYRNDPRMRS